ncbi:MAG: hypothetical protein ACYTCU_00535 [Planctomycetota bacterium]|jgi:hypothetical protein
MEKRALAAAALAVLLTAPGASVTAQSVPEAPGVAAVPGGAPREDVATRLEALGPDAASLRWAAHPVTGALRRMTGTLSGALALQGADAIARAQDFAARFGPLFDADGAVVLETPRVLGSDDEGRARWVSMPQSVHGFELIGHGLWLHFDAQGRGDAAHGVVSTVGATLSPPVVAAADAIATALAHVGTDQGALRGAPTADAVARPLDDGAELLWRVQFVLAEGLVPLAVEVRAADGTVARVMDARASGDETGTLTWDGADLVFETGKGKGLGYKSIKDAATGKEGNVNLPHLANEDITHNASVIVADGVLAGRYVRIIDNDDIVIWSSKYSYPHADDDPVTIDGLIKTYDAFDHVNTYSWMTRMAEHLTDVMGTLPSDSCMPAVVNADGLGSANAYYSTASLDLNAPGFFAFEDSSSSALDAMNDISRDPSIVCHEYAHGAVHKGGNAFIDAPVDTPPRALNEALADYAAASFLDDPRIGFVFKLHSADDIPTPAPGASLRDLTHEATLPDDLWNTVGGTGLPEEHEAGLVFGAALWRARDGLKEKVADPLVLNHLPGWPQSTAEAGFPVVTPDNATAAYAAYYYQCFEAMMGTLLADKKKGAKNAGPLLGAFLAHGITGTDAPYALDATAGSKGLQLQFESAFLGSINEHSFLVTLAAGQTLDLSVKGEKKDGTTVDFAFDADPGDFTWSKPKKTKADGSSADAKKILVNVSGTYLVTISNPGSGGGRYKAKLKAK